MCTCVLPETRTGNDISPALSAVTVLSSPIAYFAPGRRRELGCLIPWPSTSSARTMPKLTRLFAAYKGTLTPVQRNTMSGGVTVNDVLMHAGVPGTPFGGVGESGMGYYHGKHRFLAFTHTRIFVLPSTWLDRLMSFRYPPFDVRHSSKLAVKNRLGFKKGKTMEDQRIKPWPPRKTAA
ncbi:hypothetical protein QBC33DRAFT_519165 [Phialemonium atrogriseum]|uniref:Aldehyde dehydrogenase domain-containing protein n=1 Tax=Phialemonium atrogriseum TaxID=1093897 RepID=A0AAJ0FD34_9PEZI|nr:uncharacterized protein QBC33DRAFT_519165 [Phialemonium atrogriseum]KAK1762777.1 hypothetical protein QBC33DRAFT_519165 [Phialemonium atrogriseum]